MDACLDYLRENGAEPALVIDPHTVVTAPWTTFKCQFGCENFGKNHCCPPEAPDYTRTRAVLDSFSTGILFRVHHWNATAMAAEEMCIRDRACKMRHRADKLIEGWCAENGRDDVNVEAMTNEELVAFIRDNGVICPGCGKADFTDIRKFNLMFKTHQGVTEDSSTEVYLRPERCV